MWNLTQYFFENTFHQKSLLKVFTYCQQYKSFTHPNVINCILKSIEMNLIVANMNLKKIVFNVMYENGWKVIDLINVENILKCDPIFLKTLYTMSKLHAYGFWYSLP